MVLQVIPEALAATSVAVEALAERLAAAQATVAPIITAVVPPAIDPVSIETATVFSTQSSQHLLVSTQGTQQLNYAGLGVANAGTNYALTDSHAAATMLKM